MEEEQTFGRSTRGRDWKGGSAEAWTSLRRTPELHVRGSKFRGDLGGRAWSLEVAEEFKYPKTK